VTSGRSIAKLRSVSDTLVGEGMDLGLAIRIAAGKAKRSALCRGAHPIECS
jgi:hypothetical protein